MGRSVDARVWMRMVAVAAALVMLFAACSKDDEKQAGPTTTPTTTPADARAVFASMEPVNASMTFESTGAERSGWSWVGGGQKARWAFSKFPEQLTDLQLDLTMMVDAKTAEPTRGALIDLAYGQGDAKLGTQSVSIPIVVNPNDPALMIASGTVSLPRSSIPDGLSALWVEATVPNGPEVAMRGDSVRFAPLALASQPAEAKTAQAPRPTTTKGPTSKPSGHLTGDFTSDGDPISGWYWLRDAAAKRSASWTFTGVPSGKEDVRLELEVLATDRANGGPGLDAQFYLDYAFGTGGDDGGATTGSSKPKPSTTQKPKPTASTVPPPQASTTTSTPGVSGANSRLVTLTNTSPPGDPVGYTNTGVITIPREKIPAGAQTLTVKVTRADPDGANAVPGHVAVRQQSVTLAWGPDTAGSTSTTTSTTAPPSTTTTTADDGTGPDGGDTGPGSDTDVTDDADSMDDADDRGDLPDGEYQGTLQGEDDDWFAFQMEETQLVDIAVTSDAGATIETELYAPTRDRREPRSGQPNRMAFTHAAPRGGGGRWYLHLHRVNGVDTAYTFTIDVRDANDGNRGVDAADEASGALAVTYQTMYGELVAEDQADTYTVQVGAGQHVTASLTPLSGQDFAMELRPPTGSALDDGTTGGQTLTLDADASTATAVRIVVTRDGGDGGRYKLKLESSVSDDCTAPPVSSASFATSGGVTSRVVHYQDGVATDLLVSGREPINDSAWRWLQANAPRPAEQSAEWVFDQLPNGDGDYHFTIDVPLEQVADDAVPDGAVYVTYGAIPGSGVDAIQGGELVGLSASTNEPLTGFAGHGEITVPNAVLASATQGIWVRVELSDPLAQRPSASGAGIGVDPASVQLCVGVRGTTSLSGITTPPAPTVSYDGPTRSMTSTASIFSDPTTDLDHDGLNQGFENAAADVVNPILELDDEEMWLHNRRLERTTNFVKVSPYPSSVQPTYVIFSYLSTWSFDPGGGLQQPFTAAQEYHRGDSERVYTAWRIVDDRTLSLTWVSTSAHKSINDHSGVWHVSDRICNTANWALVSMPDNVGLPTFGVGGQEPMCDSLTFDDQGRLVMYTAENKHAMYPSAGLCESVALGKFSGSRVYGEDCGWTPGNYDWSWKESQFTDDPRYLGNGRWRFNVFNVGEPGYRLIDDLDAPGQWKGLTSAQTSQLIGSYPDEAVWSGNVDNGSQFCGGMVAGGPRIYPPGDSYPEAPPTGPDCSTRLGTKYEDVPTALDDALKARYRIEIKTGGVDGAGTDEYIWLQVLDASDTVLAGRGNYLGDLERNATDILWLSPQHTGGPFAEVLVGRSSNGGNRPDWYLESIVVEDKVGGLTHTFPVNQWINAFQTYTLTM